MTTDTGPTDTTGATSRRPNILLIMSDDLGYEAIGVNGCTSYATPRLDALASEDKSREA